MPKLRKRKALLTERRKYHYKRKRNAEHDDVPSHKDVSKNQTEVTAFLLIESI